MPAFLSNSKLIGNRLLRKDGLLQFIRSANKVSQKGNCVPVRYYTSVAGIDKSSACNSVITVRDLNYYLGNIYNTTTNIQRRSFLGCGYGEEGSALSKIHEERRVMG